MIQAVQGCRICGNTRLEPVLDLGEQSLTGVFPRTPGQPVTRGPLRLVKCSGAGDAACGLLQLEHSYALDEMYGDNYGYRSGLNASMVRHLEAKVARILGLLRPGAGDIVLDIGSNDGTTLNAYPREGARFIGMDPTARKFRPYYRPDIEIVADFFSASHFAECFPGQRARVVTSFSMFYDLEAPLDFMRQIAEVLADDGVWVFEQSYMPTMLERNAYDTVCHEHLEYYALKQIAWMAQRCGLKIVDVEFNDVNGGSFSVTACHRAAPHAEYAGLATLLQGEQAAGLDTLEPYRAFAARSGRLRDELRALVASARADGRRVAALGASTKGNVVLQYCGFGPDDIVAIGEVNDYKFGRFAPGSLIPIVDEKTLLPDGADLYLILPWHFRDFLCQRYPELTGRLLFPLPEIEVV